MTIFAYGFRTFFFLSGLAAVTLVLGWLRVLLGSGSTFAYIDPVGWHAHEMLFGYVSAMIAGFLLTAVPNWTGEKAHRGRTLALLAALWMTARFLLLFSNSRMSGIVDLAFLPALVTLLVPSLLRAKQPKTLVFVPILILLWISNLLTHLQTWRIADTRSDGLSLGIGLIVLLIALIGGRVIPFFTRVALKTEPRKSVWLEGLAIATVVLLPVLEIGQASTGLVVAWSVAAVVVHGLRLWGWLDRRVWRVPLLWVLHVGYAWLVLGLALKGMGALGLVPSASAVHAFTGGAMGVVGLGIMSRASLGHTGRPLEPSTATVYSFVAINLAAFIRVFGPLTSLDARLVYGLSGGFWCFAFLLFLWVYSPILFSPRADGKPG